MRQFCLDMSQPGQDYRAFLIAWERFVPASVGVAWASFNSSTSVSCFFNHFETGNFEPDTLTLEKVCWCLQNCKTSKILRIMLQSLHTIFRGSSFYSHTKHQLGCYKVAKRIKEPPHGGSSSLYRSFIGDESCVNTITSSVFASHWITMDDIHLEQVRGFYQEEWIDTARKPLVYKFRWALYIWNWFSSLSLFQSCWTVKKKVQATNWGWPIVMVYWNTTS